MKLFYALALLVLSATTAEACEHTRQQFICPGDSVVDQYNRLGRVRGVNPFQQTASYQLQAGSLATDDISTLALGMGCLEAFCVNDRIVDQYNRAGIVIAVNPYSNTVAYRLTAGSIASDDISTLTVNYGCVMGYCVGDDIVDQYNRAGRIVAVSPYDSNVAYQLQAGSLATDSAETLSNSAFCADYGQQHRRMPRFTKLGKGRYVAPDFRWYSKR